MNIPATWKTDRNAYAAHAQRPKGCHEHGCLMRLTETQLNQ